MVHQKGSLKITKLGQISQNGVVKSRTWIGNGNEDLLGDMEEAKIGIAVNEFGRECWVLE